MISISRCTVFISAVALVFLLIVLGSGQLFAAPQGDSSNVIVKMTADHKFVPDHVTIKKGQTVEWVGEDENSPHEVTDDPDKAQDSSDVSSPAGSKLFYSGDIGKDKSFKYTFTVPGTYNYVCPPHEQDDMKGVVTVTE